MTLLLLALMGSADAGDWPVRAAHQVPQKEGILLRWDPARSWGSSELVETLEQVATRLSFEMPMADPLLIGDVSKRGGGRMFGHTTHHIGVDADIGLFTGDGEQPLGGFQDVHTGQLDLEANWALIRALLDTGKVAFVLLDQRHIDALRRYALHDLKLDAELVSSIFPPADTLVGWHSHGVVRHAPNHRSHLHIRVGAASGS